MNALIAAALAAIAGPANAQGTLDRMFAPEQRAALEAAERRAEEVERALSPAAKAAREESRRRLGEDMRRALEQLPLGRSGSGPAALEERALVVAGTHRRYFVHTPRRRPGAPLPAVLDFAGEAWPARVEIARMNRAADRFGFIAVYPEGPADEAFLRAVLDDLPVKFGADAARLYAAGGGDEGGAQAARAACSLADRLAAVALVETREDLAPRRPLPLALLTTSPSPRAARWRRANRCRPEPARILRRPGHTLERYEAARGIGAPVAVYRMDARGRVALPGGAAMIDLSAPGSADARALMWGFFAEFSSRNPSRSD